MNFFETQILVIGGGATGTGILRDLAMRGFEAALVDKSDLSTGTTGRFHGLLHSGGRYVVKDPQTAKECMEENIILRHIMPHCIEDTGGFFVLTPEDDPDYAQDFLNGCKQSGISTEEIPIDRMLKEEPLLNPNILRCFRVPDASADSFMASEANSESAKLYGAKVLRYHEIKDIIKSNHQVIGVKCHNILNNTEVEIYAEIVINASGAWAGKIANLAGLEVHIIPGKGTMIATNHRLVNTVINRCKKPSDGDILVPSHTVSVIGTTDVPVADPDKFAIDPWEIHLLLKEGNLIIPGFRDMRMLRAWAGVRPLYQETIVDDTREVARSYALLDHQFRDNTPGFITITSGKWTTYRKMAEVTVDLVCEKLGKKRECRTHIEPITNSREHSFYYLGSRLAKIEKEKEAGHLICECELVTYDDIKNTIKKGDTKSIDDIRRSIRLGMGPCQGGFCTLRVAGILHKLRPPHVIATNTALRDFLQERWKGLLPILWGQQLRQERLDELIYLSLLNTDHLPGDKKSSLSPILYEETSQDFPEDFIKSKEITKKYPNTQISSIGTQPDVLIIGAGLGGLSAAWISTSEGKKTHLISKGQGSLYWHTGCIDILGYLPEFSKEMISEPIKGLQYLIDNKPSHPYAIVGIEKIEEALTQFQLLCDQYDYPLHGSIEKNWVLPSSLGAQRPTCLAPFTMIAGDLIKSDPIWIIGFEGYYDFYPELIADNINTLGIQSKGITLDIPSLRGTTNINSLSLARNFENGKFRQEVIREIKSQFRKEHEFIPKRIGFPAILGIRNTKNIIEDFRENIGLPIFEIPTLPPSIPGIRISNILTDSIEKSGGRINIGMEAIGFELEPVNSNSTKRIQTIWSESAARRKPHKAKKTVLATGGLLGGGLYAQFGGKVTERIFNLPVSSPKNHNEWFERQFLSKRNHPIFQSGIIVNKDFQPIDTAGKITVANLFVVGTTLGGYDFLRERSFDGVPLVTGYAVGKNI